MEPSHAHRPQTCGYCSLWSRLNVINYILISEQLLTCCRTIAASLTRMAIFIEVTPLRWDPNLDLECKIPSLYFASYPQNLRVKDLHNLESFQTDELRFGYRCNVLEHARNRSRISYCQFHHCVQSGSQARHLRSPSKSKIVFNI